MMEPSGHRAKESVHVLLGNVGPEADTRPQLQSSGMWCLQRGNSVLVEINGLSLNMGRTCPI